MAHQQPQQQHPVVQYPQGHVQASAIPDDGSWRHKDPYGYSRPCCCFVCTKDASHSLVLSFFVLLPTVVFTTSVVPATEWYSIVIVTALAALSLVILVCAVGLDPGIVPPASVTGEVYDPEREYTIDFEGAKHKVRVCRTCRVPKLPRSSHCSFCNYCVEDYDHHCGVLGSCVAKRTFRFFAYFFDVTTLLAAYIFVRSCIAAHHFDWDSANESHTHRWYAVAIIGCIGYTALTGCCVVSQALFYMKLACDGTTQKQLYGREAVQRRKVANQSGDPAHELGHMSCGNYCNMKCGPLGTPRLSLLGSNARGPVAV